MTFNEIRTVSGDIGIYSNSIGIENTGLRDQYSDGKAAKVWELYIGSKNIRTSIYKDWFCSLLRKRKVKNVLDCACGTGVDSVMLLEEGFDVVSTDASDKMLKYALKERWKRRKEGLFDRWIIEEANWMTLKTDLENISDTIPTDGFDAVLCLGNSFAHLLDVNGDQKEQLIALSNMKDILKKGGILVIDHRNYDNIIKTGCVPVCNNVYYPSTNVQKIKTIILNVEGKPQLITLDYMIDTTPIMTDQQLLSLPQLTEAEQNKLKFQNFTLSYYPHTLVNFNKLIERVFPGCSHDIFADFQPIDKVKVPSYYIHVISKK